MQLPLTQSWSPETPLKEETPFKRAVKTIGCLRRHLHGFDGLGHVGVEIEELLSFLAVARDLGHAGGENSVVDLARLAGKLDTRNPFWWQCFEDNLRESQVNSLFQFRGELIEQSTYIRLFLFDAEELNGASRIADDHFL